MKLMKKFSGQVVVLSIFILAISISMVSGAIFQYSKINEYNNKILSLNKQIKDIDKETKYLKNTKVDEENLEKLARKRLNMIKSNEIVYIDILKESK